MCLTEQVDKGGDKEAKGRDMRQAHNKPPTFNTGFFLTSSFNLGLIYTSIMFVFIKRKCA